MPLPITTQIGLVIAALAICAASIFVTRARRLKDAAIWSRGELDMHQVVAKRHQLVGAASIAALLAVLTAATTALTAHGDATTFTWIACAVLAFSGLQTCYTARSA